MKKRLYTWQAKFLLVILFLVSAACMTAGLIGWLVGSYYYITDAGLYDESLAEALTEAQLFLSMDKAESWLLDLNRFATPLLIIGMLLCAVTVILLVLAAGHRPNAEENTVSGQSTNSEKIYLRRIDRVPYELYVIGSFIAIGICSVGIILFSEELFFSWDPVSDYLAVRLILLAFIAGCNGLYLLCLHFTLTTAVRIKAHSFRKYTIAGWVVHFFRSRFSRYTRSNRPWSGRSFTVHLILVIAAFVLLEWFIIIFTAYEWDHELICWLIYRAITVPVIILIAFQWKTNREAIRSAAAGNMEIQVDTTHMYYDFRSEAEDINRLQDAISEAVARQMASERMKTELITNVSHDIRTPLTSIVNYVDLLDKKIHSDEVTIDPEPEYANVEEYLEVLTRQSARLKKLIDDLLEASKASTGNLDVEPVPMDAKVILDQAVGEFEDRLHNAGLEIVVKDDVDVQILADGRHLWRVYDNLLGNICKYAQPGTRVYVDLLNHTPSMIQIIFRNISKDALNISEEELMERFTRGDKSRNTEGSGLGLSIAQSLMQLMNGSMQIKIDGDLFKVTLELPAAGNP